MTKIEYMAEFLLEMFDLEDILEMNNLTPHEVLELLIQGGHIEQPERILQELEDQQVDEEDEEFDF